MRLRASASPNPRLEPLLRGEVSDPGIEFDWHLGHPGELFRRHLSGDEFDLFEFSLSAYLEVRAAERLRHLRWTALPVFLSKAMLLFELCVRRDGAVGELADLRGRTVGVPDVRMTAAVWLRILLRELSGLDCGDVAWVNGRPPARRHSTVLEAPDPPGTRVSELPSGESLQSLLESGAVDAAFGDHAAAAVAESGGVRRLFDAAGVQALMERFATRTHVTPVNHVVVVQQRLLDATPGMADGLRRLFDRSRDAAYERARDRGGALRFDDDGITWRRDVFGDDPYASGVEPNRAMLTVLLEQLQREGQLREPLTLQALFATD